MPLDFEGITCSHFPSAMSCTFPIICYSNSMRAVIFVIMGRDYLSLGDVCVCLCGSVFFFMVLKLELGLCRQPVLILWPSPQLQHAGNKPLSSNLQTVQQSMGNYLSQSMVLPLCFSPFASTAASSIAPALISSLVSHFCCLSVFFSTHSFMLRLLL